jgi:Protein of unknown function (DUF4199)
MKKKSSDYLAVAVVISLLLIVLDLIGGFAHLRFESWFRWCSTVLLVAGLIYSCIQYGKQKADGVTFGNVFGYGFKISLIVSALMVVYTLISINVIFPEYIGQLLEKSRSDMEAKGGLSEAQIDQGVAMTKKFLQPVPLSIFTFVVMLFVGTIGSLLGAAFTKKSEPVPTIFQDNP